MVEWGRLLSGYRGEILGRRFESCPPRHIEKRVHTGAFFFKPEGHKASGKKRTVKSYFRLIFIPRCEPLNPNLS